MKTKNKLVKRISYCSPKSALAKDFGSHGYYVEQTLHNIEGSGQCRISPDESAYTGNVFSSIRDPELITTFKEADGLVDKSQTYQEWLILISQEDNQ